MRVGCPYFQSCSGPRYRRMAGSSRWIDVAGPYPQRQFFDGGHASRFRWLDQGLRGRLDMSASTQWPSTNSTGRLRSSLPSIPWAPSGNTITSSLVPYRGRHGSAAYAVRGRELVGRRAVEWSLSRRASRGRCLCLRCGPNLAGRTREQAVARAAPEVGEGARAAPQ